MLTFLTISIIAIGRRGGTGIVRIITRLAWVRRAPWQPDLSVITRFPWHVNLCYHINENAGLQRPAKANSLVFAFNLPPYLHSTHGFGIPGRPSAAPKPSVA